MAADGRFDGRNRLILPVAAVLTLMWVVAGLKAMLTGDNATFLIVSTPFGLLCGYVFGVSIIRPSRE